MENNSIKKNVFKAYDIRGIYPTEVNEAFAYCFSRAYVTYLKKKKLIIGRDMRLSSPSLCESIIKGAVFQGADVIDIGMVSSDMFYFACGKHKLPGIIVTASHNPAEYNGFKSVIDMPIFLSGGNGMDEIYEIIVKNQYDVPQGEGTITKNDVAQDYVEKIRSIIDFKSIKPFKIVVDAASGMGGYVFKLVAKYLPIEIVPLYLEPDGHFPGHGGDPLLEENRRELQERVVSEKADMGFAFDPDADRFFVVDRDGAFIPGDFITAILGSYFVEKSGGGSVIYDTRASWAVRDTIKAAGGSAIECRVGHAFIKPKMLENKAVFGGEISGHYYFPDFYYADSGVLTSLVVLEMLSKKQKDITELLQPIRDRYFISGEINSVVKNADAAIEKLKMLYGDKYEMYEIDGISIIGSDWHANIRKSNTEPLLRLNVEGLDKETLCRKRDELLSIIRS